MTPSAARDEGIRRSVGEAPPRSDVVDQELEAVLDSIVGIDGVDATALLVTDLDGGPPIVRIVDRIESEDALRSPAVTLATHVLACGRAIHADLGAPSFDRIVTTGGIVIRRALGVPLTIGDRTVGVLVAMGAGAERFDDGVAHVVASMGVPLAYAIERARLFDLEREARQVAEHVAHVLNVRQRTTAALGRARSVADIVDATVDGSAELVGSVSPAVEIVGRVQIDLDRLVDAHADPSGAHEPVVTVTEAATVVTTALDPTDPHRGVLVISYPTALEFDLPELRYFASLAAEASVAIERIEWRQAQGAAMDRLAFLEEATLVMTGSLDRHEVIQHLASIAVPRLADWVGIHGLSGDDGIDRLAVVHRDPELTRLAQRLVGRFAPARNSTNPMSIVVREAKPMLVIDFGPAVTAKAPREVSEVFAQLGMGSAMYVPLIFRGSVIGVMTFVVGPDRRTYTEDDLVLAGELARRAAVAVANATAYESEHALAAMLTDTVGPPDLPSVAGVELAARYLPAAPAPLGGDWYDAFVLPDGALLCTVGDVAGHGMSAASLMIRLASAIQAFATVDDAPASILERLHRHFERVRAALFGDALMATVAVAKLDPLSGTLETASAGHVPFLHIRGDRATFGPDGDRALISGFGQAKVASHTLALEPGDLVMFFTDGLVERRNEMIDEGLERLAQVALAHRDRPLRAFCDAIIDHLAPTSSRSDDCCVLALRFSGSDVSS